MGGIVSKVMSEGLCEAEVEVFLAVGKSGEVVEVRS
jgi:hypothetical protein